MAQKIADSLDKIVDSTGGIFNIPEYEKWALSLEYLYIDQLDIPTEEVKL